MASYTVELRRLIEQGYKLDLDSYPIFDEEYRPYLNRKIIDHFYFREIGQETPDRFNFFLGRTMREIMPYYNKLYESELMSYDPLATEYISRQRDDELNVSRETEEVGKRKVGETTGQVFTGSTDAKNIGNLKGSHEQTVKGDYTKHGDDIKERDLTKNEVLNEKITNNTLTTNDLRGTSNTETDTTANKQATLTKNTTFSDLPQANISTTITRAADGGLAINSNGYATTTTNETTNSQEDATEHGTSDNTTTSTGTVDVDGTSNRDQTIDTTEHETIKDLWNENGNDTNVTNFTETQNTDDYTLTKEDTETNIARNEKSTNVNKSKQTEAELSSQVESSKGRSGVDPSSLIVSYRESLINIDLMIIADLESLFMGVY